ncbi:hypothetical protein BFJ63_vAg17655 [Fusarium oxysporum f. sp. narcissi]|uniref:Ribonuclease H1 N-terminal domain-containing protein n=1 Tax=Fusarium oxysporum f. sp. narcissi TaxID=451672 RepID=A0A4Q2V595_FUSOX|nr:hypothetical protein BFJ63_vAg17655 [Fusarium oxysporum f. sp. narcissi]
MGKTKQNKEYYAVVKGRVDRPIIFSSWGDAHPRVTGCHSEYSSFYTIDDARAYMSKKGVEDAEEVIKDGAGETTPLPDGPIYYAVAYGSQPGIYPFWQ